jgi:hypothetical protein
MKWPPVWLASHLHRYFFVQDGLPVPIQNASTRSLSTCFLRTPRPRWIPTRKTTLIKATAIFVLSFAWLYAVHKHYSTIRRPGELSSTIYELQIQEDDTHHTFRSAKPGPTSRNPLSIRAYGSMSDTCVEEWVVHHRWGPACIGTDLSEGLKVDGVWAWVNGSDPLQIISRQRYRPTGNMKLDAAHRYTEHDELLYSMRSALASLGTDVMQRLHILASAYHLPNGSDDDMVGQVPAWLNKEEALSSNGGVVLHHDANYFKPIASPETHLSQLEVQRWRDAVIPSFNSLAVESQIHNIDGPTSDQLVYYNDDFFTLRKLAVSDYTTPLYGPVMKTLTRVSSRYTPAENTIYRFINPAGEEPGIKRAAWVLGRRFSMRPYYYITHHPRTLSLPLLLEAAQTFPEAFSKTPLSRFRAQSDVPVSIQTVFLGSWYIVERHREALLWSWIVAKWGGKGGLISPTLKHRMWIELADEPSPSWSYLSVGIPIRVPVEDVEVFKKTNVDIPTSTEYSFSSKDGYALSYVESMWFWNRPRHGYPDLTRGLVEDQTGAAGSSSRPRFIRDPYFKPSKACSIVRSTCFGLSSKDETSSEFFKRVTFEQPKCGDCIIMALIGASGESGIDKFLPDHDAKAVSEVYSETMTGPSHLPLTSEWTTTDFSMSSAIPKGSIRHDTTLRTWCVRLIQRYSYVLGSASADFYKVERANKLESKLDEVEHMVEEENKTTDVVYTELPSDVKDRWRHEMGENKGPLAFLCLNDDIKERGELRDSVDQLLSKFFRKMWTSKMSFEKSA